MSADRAADRPESADGTLLQKPVDRRDALGLLLGGVAASVAAVGACAPLSAATPEERELKLLEWEEFTQKHYRRMTEEERAETIARLERLAKLRHNEDCTIATTDAQPGVLFGYAFNISKCKGYRRCVEACINENNLDRHQDTQYIRIFEMENGVVNLDEADPTYQHEVPAEGHFYLGTQCFQ
ncbi:MAG TPA: hypothetical protein VLA89_13535, partial [Gemmatimonadales bacterium]|nr:hypothetical protein [Gemmatimonadales bacterium]